MQPQQAAAGRTSIPAPKPRPTHVLFMHTQADKTSTQQALAGRGRRRDEPATLASTRSSTHNQHSSCTFLLVVELLLCCHGDVIFLSRGAVVFCFQLHYNVGVGEEEGGDAGVIRNSLKRRL